MPSYVVIDGSNLEKEGGSLIALQTAIRQIGALRPSGEIVVRTYVDANLRHKIKISERASYEEMVQGDLLSQVPAGTKADEYILKWAKEQNAIIVSNDSYKDYEGVDEILCGSKFDKYTNRWTFIERNYGKDRNARDLEALLDVQLGTESKNSNHDLQGSYSARVTSTNPACVLILVDQSISMRGKAIGSNKSKADVVAERINNLIEELVLSSTKGFNELKPYFDIAVIGYGFSKEQPLASLLPSTDIKMPFKSIDEVNQSVDVVDDQPTWIRPHADGTTPMCEAFLLACELIESWVVSHKSSYPPVVINVTDGIPTDGDPEPEVSRIGRISTNDGLVIIFNAHIAGSDFKKSGRQNMKQIENEIESGQKFLYPSSDDGFKDDKAKFLYKISSTLPSVIVDRARDLNLEVNPGAKAFVYNCGVDDLVKLFKLGTPTR